MTKLVKTQGAAVTNFGRTLPSPQSQLAQEMLKDINKPLGVATYQLQEVVDRTVAELELRAKHKGH